VKRMVLRFAVPALAAAVAAVAPALSPAAAQLIGTSDDSLAGLEWTFVRIRYETPQTGTRYTYGYWGDPWAIDAPAAEQNLSRRLKTVTSLQVGEPKVLTLEDPSLFEHPWIYFVEPGFMHLKDEEVPILREFLLRGGTATFDDFHGPVEWDHFAGQMRRVFPDREIVDLPNTHPIFSTFYSIDKYPQIPGLGSFLAGRTWEKGGFTATLRAILDDNGRPMVIINWNTDMGDGWEWSNAEDYPGYVRFTSEAYRMGINQIVYALTH
jgi:hypothetical protein